MSAGDGRDTDAFASGDRVAPPMSNGELVFEAPWQGRVFGMARALADAGVFDWEELRACLIEELAGHVPGGASFAYYDHFQRALERVLAGKRLVTPEALCSRVDAFSARPHDHDHSH